MHMFLSRMVNDLFNSNKNTNHQVQQSQQQQQQQQQQNLLQTKSPKTVKKSDKNKRSVTKSESKKSICELLGKNHVKDTTTSTVLTTYKSDNQLPSTSKGTNPSNTISNSNSSNNNNNNNNSSKNPPTKVKSGSWKRTEKQISGFNALPNKKSKGLRKRSPTWLKFPSSTVKIAEKSPFVNAVETTSVCRPGTLYSDVLFGAGSSCLVKVKTLTPRRGTNTSQKKLTKALMKCSGTDPTEISDESELEIESELFPSLHVFTSNKPSTSASSASTSRADSLKTTPILDSSSVRNDTVLLGTVTHKPSPNKNDTYEEADIVILQDRNDIQLKDKEISYGNYLDHHFQHLNGDTSGLGVSCGGASCSSVKKTDNNRRLAIDIASWNFLDADVSKDAFPKFLCQFDDEHYLKAEKMALLGLKLALGNSSQQSKFKF